jgi:eukaryotic-like serine/threonine-protein kinase
VTLATLEADRVIAGRYRLERALAKGGMGQVWAARHVTLDAPVAVKFMDPALVADADARRRFEREAKAAAALRSPHVVQILDFGLDEGTPFLVMELLRGETLQDRLRRDGALARVTVAKIVAQSCKALELAAEAGIVHRDLKPANLYLTRSGREETVKVLDFGVAKGPRSADAGETTASGRMLGSPHYMSPEQARGGLPVDPRSDLWSLGVIAFHMLTGKKPFDGPELGEIILQICAEPIPHPSDHGLPEAADRWFARALARDPAARFESPAAFSSSFHELCVELGDAEAELRGPLLVPAGAPAVASQPASGADDGTFDSATALETLRGTITHATPPPRSKSRAGLVVALAATAAIAAFLVYRAFDGASAPAASVERPPAPTAVETAASLPPPASVVLPEPAAASATASQKPPAHPPAATADRHRILGY